MGALPPELWAVVRRAQRIARELGNLHDDVQRWDGAMPPVQHLSERLEAVEIDLLNLEAEMRALRRDR